jgi:hypothetical protein
MAHDHNSETWPPIQGARRSRREDTLRLELVNPKFLLINTIIFDLIACLYLRVHLMPSSLIQSPSSEDIAEEHPRQCLKQALQTMCCHFNPLG